MVVVLVRVSTAVIKHQEKRKLGEQKRFISAYSSHVMLYHGQKSG